MAVEQFVALRQFHLGPDRIIKVGEMFDGEAADIRESGILAGKFPQAVRAGDPRIKEAVEADKVKRARAKAREGASVSALLKRIEKLEAARG